MTSKKKKTYVDGTATVLRVIVPVVSCVTHGHPWIVAIQKRTPRSEAGKYTLARLASLGTAKVPIAVYATPVLPNPPLPLVVSDSSVT